MRLKRVGGGEELSKNNQERQAVNKHKRTETNNKPRIVDRYKLSVQIYGKHKQHYNTFFLLGDTPAYEF